MKAMLLAAGRGERLRPLTDVRPKPLLEVGGKPLIAWQLERLAEAGVTDVVINLAHLGAQIPAALGDGAQWKLRLHYSQEPAGALETAGGIRLALPLLGEAPFILANADVWTDFDFRELPTTLPGLAHLVMVDNPAHHPTGDFGLSEGLVTLGDGPRLTYAGLGVYSPGLVRDLAPGSRAALAPLLRAAINEGRVSGQKYPGRWIDVGTVERLAEADDAARFP